MISQVVWDYRKEFDDIDIQVHDNTINGENQLNHLINVNSISEFVNTSFEDGTLIKKRWKNIKKLREIQKKMHKDKSTPRNSILKPKQDHETF